MSDVQTKLAVFAEWKAGRSKASLAVQHDVSPRTIGRWIEEAPSLVQPTAELVEQYYAEEVVEPKKESKDTRYLEAYEIKQHLGAYTSELAKRFEVSESTIRRWLKRAEEEQTQTDVFEIELTDESSVIQYTYVASSKSITITQTTNGKVTGSVSSDRSADNFSEYLDTLIDNAFSQETLSDVFVALQPAKTLEKFSQGKLQVDAQRRQILYVADEDTVPYEVNNSLTQRVIDMVRNGDSGVQTLLNFLEKLMENPSRRSVNELYGFLEATDIEIAEDGDFYAWKKVRPDYMDIHSNTMDNTPGKVLRVARNMVDEDSERTCSFGLHVCSKSYLPSFGSCPDNRVVKVKVNPADVVAVPSDYHNAKMRTAGYVVLEDVSEQFGYGRVREC